MPHVPSTYHCRVYFSILPLDVLDLLLAVLVLLAVSEIILEVKVLSKISKVYEVFILSLLSYVYMHFAFFFCFRQCNVSSTVNKNMFIHQILLHIWLPSDQNKNDLPATPGIIKTINMKEE